jgi:hypothetical protein
VQNLTKKPLCTCGRKRKEKTPQAAITRAFSSMTKETVYPASPRTSRRRFSAPAPQPPLRAPCIPLLRYGFGARRLIFFLISSLGSTTALNS